ncbi:hypothetical protein H1V43_24310 [Streptomyces sp. PSKA54]|uniref:Lipoprotein n=1 Tax=Streptomyces himalayensis subsp. aureolus TaxID=2758039 RepID=A0A7W2HHW2_9ACTN|nr:hypothetical protein [Streptomyces himalayensis]MBA4864420.1 hypothetical protein [Streptomyces himalayensis subsp. aureolus]
MAKRKTLTLAVATLPLLAMVTVGCSDEKNEKEGVPVPQLAKEFCDSSLTPAAAKAFEKLFAGQNVKEASDSGKLTEAAEELKQATGDDVSTCGVVSYGSVDYGMRIEFGWSYGPWSPDDTSEYAFFTAGDRAFSNGRFAYVLVKCSASVPKLDPDEEHYLLVSLNGPEADLPLAERQKLLVSIVYPVLRKMAGVVGCKEAADLPASPSLSTTAAPEVT